MTARLTLLCHAPTIATQNARFPRDEAMGGGASKATGSLARLQGRILAGPERRCRQTADALGAAAVVDEGLRDQDFGRWAGLTLAEVAAAEPDAVAAWTRDPDATPHGGETLAALFERVADWMSVRAAAGGRAAAVTHPAVVRAAISLAVGAGTSGFWRIEAAPLTTATLSHDGRRWSLAGLVPPP